MDGPPGRVRLARSDRHFRIGVGAPAKLQMTEETAAMLALKKAIP
jgi:hypothetical protein